jgi:hypothetical protein
VWGGSGIATTWFQSPTNLVALQGAKTIAGWYQNEEFTKSLVTGTLAYAKTSGMTVQDIYPSQPGPTPMAYTVAQNYSQSMYDELASQLKDMNPDVVMAGSRLESCVMFLVALKKVDWLPKALFASHCVQNLALLEPELIKHGLSMADARYLIDFQLWDPRLKGVDFEETQSLYFPPTAPLTSPHAGVDRLSWLSS